MTATKQHRAPWIARVGITLATIALGVLLFWLLNLLTADIRSTGGPDWNKVEQEFTDKQTRETVIELNDQLKRLDRQLALLQSRQQVTTDNARNLQTTINQLHQLQRISLEKLVPLSDREQESLSTSLAQFLATQEKVQQTGEEIATLTAEKETVTARRDELNDQLEQQRTKAREHYDRLNDRHRFLQASIQLAFLLPLLALAAWLLIRRRGSVYYPFIIAFAGAVLLKVAFVIEEYFPSRWFKYIFIAGLLVVVGWLLWWLIRSVAFPRRDWLLRQFREAYDRFLCPVCEFPIRIGPRRFMVWTRKTALRIQPRAGADAADQPYTCPACGTTLFEQCPACGGIRHTLLPHCRHCGTSCDMDQQNTAHVTAETGSDTISL